MNFLLFWLVSFDPPLNNQDRTCHRLFNLTFSETDAGSPCSFREMRSFLFFSKHITIKHVATKPVQHSNDDMFKKKRHKNGQNLQRGGMVRVNALASVTAVGSLEGFPHDDFKSFWLSFQSSLHLSLTVLVRYRSFACYLALDGIYRPRLQPTSLARNDLKNECFGLRSRTAWLTKHMTRWFQQSHSTIWILQQPSNDTRMRKTKNTKTSKDIFVFSVFNKQTSFDIIDDSTVKVTNGIVTLHDAPFQRTWTQEWTAHAFICLRDHNSEGDLLQCQWKHTAAFRLKAWAVPVSLAATKGILVGFFSSTDWYA